MLFSSMTFIFLFLPIVCALYFGGRRELHNGILLAASILFYAWDEPRRLAVMLVVVLIAYFGALGIVKFANWRRYILGLSILANLGFLVYFKYFDFLIENLNHIFSAHLPLLGIVLPIGISFYIFQAISYVIDVYRGECPAQHDFYKLALYITFFPQLVAGPIVKYHEISDQLNDRKTTFDDVLIGVKRFIVGLSKKILLANTFGAVVDKIFEQPIEGLSVECAWVGAIFYSLQLFYDFSGYSDMAIGLGRIFGFRFCENFDYPYTSRSITEFWRRWHISLSTWFKEYLYIPLGGNRCGRCRTYLNLFVVFIITGIWHGAEWSFIIWGVWHGIFIIFEKFTGLDKKRFGFFLNAVRHFYVISVFIIGWVIFRSPDINYALKYLGVMFGQIQGTVEFYTIKFLVDREVLLVFAIGIICTMPFFRNIIAISPERKALSIITNVWLIFLFLLSSAAIAASTYNPFIYFRF